MQVAEHLRAFAKPAGVWVVPVVGGMSLPKQRRYHFAGHDFRAPVPCRARHHAHHHIASTQLPGQLHLAIAAACTPTMQR